MLPVGLTHRVIAQSLVLHRRVGGLLRLFAFRLFGCLLGGLLFRIAELQAPVYVHSLLVLRIDERLKFAHVDKFRVDNHRPFLILQLTAEHLIEMLVEQTNLLTEGVALFAG